MSNYNGPGDLESTQLEVTAALIEYDHQTVEITRPRPTKRQPDGSVAPTGTPHTLEGQKLFFSGVTGDDIRIVSWEGEKVRAAFVLIGMPSADFRKGDKFSLWRREFVVVEMHEDTRWQRKGWVFARGRV